MVANRRPLANWSKSLEADMAAPIGCRRIRDETRAYSNAPDNGASASRSWLHFPLDVDAVVLLAGRIGAGGGGRVVMRVVRFTPPLTTGPSLSGFTLLNELAVFLIQPSIAILLRSVIGILLEFAARKLDMDIFRRAGKVEAWRLIGRF